MGTAIKKELLLEGLDCANCAVKIEDKVRELDSVASASINYATKTLTIKTNREDKTQEIIADTINMFEKFGMNDIIKEEYEQIHVKPDKCTGCGDCMSRCPFGINVKERMSKAALNLSFR